MKLLALPVLALSLAAFAMPAAASCGWGKATTTEKPKETVEKPSA
ncbi:MAG: hypothetical protein ACFBRM_03060 [Pikeienuella sp.]